MSKISQIADNVAGYDKTSKSGDSKKTSQTADNRKTIDARKLGNYLNANNVNPGNNSGDDISDRISDKRNSARNKAMKLINDAWERDNETSQGIKDMQDSKEAVVTEIREANSKISDIDKELDNLKELYGVEFDSADSDWQRAGVTHNMGYPLTFTPSNPEVATYYDTHIFPHSAGTCVFTITSESGIVKYLTVIVH